MKSALLFILLLPAWLIWRTLRTSSVPTAGSGAPDFELPDQHGNVHRLADYAGRWLVLYFYPRNDTPGCTREACAFRDGLARLQAAGAAVVGVSVDTQSSHFKFDEKYHLGFPLLADTKGSAARHYGTLLDWQIFRVAKRSTFLINPQGRIHGVFTHIDPARHADEILAELAKATQ